MKKKQGISLIVLIITIVVIIILAAAVILTIANNNPVEDAKKAVMLNDISNYKDQLTLYVSRQYIDTQGAFNIADINGKLEDVVPEASKYADKFRISDGVIFAAGNHLTDQEKEWLTGFIEIKNPI